MTAQTENALRVRRRIESKVRRYMDENGCWPAHGRLLLAVSGGPDSTALALILSTLAERQSAHLTLAYFDHALRGEAESQAEAESVDRLAEKLGLPLVTAKGDVRALSKRERLSLEEAARRARYEFLAEASREAGARVATGHTASDQAETVLMHILRGAGLQGLAGMAPVSPWPVPGYENLMLVRPLLCLTREETAAYCRASGVEPIEDESNESPAFLRNRLRHDLLPKLRKYNPRVDEALVRLAAAARDGLQHLQTAADEAVTERKPGQISLSLPLLQGSSLSQRQHVLRVALQELLGDVQSIGERHFRALDRLMLRGRTGDQLDLPRGVHASLTRDVVVLRTAAEENWALPGDIVCLDVPGEAKFGPLVVEAHPSTGSGQAEKDLLAEVDAEALGEVVRVRRRRPGDRFQPLGMQETKKLQDFFVDAHVPRAERDQAPIFETDRGIVWVGGLRIAEWAKPVPGHPTLFLAFRPTAR